MKIFHDPEYWRWRDVGYWVEVGRLLGWIAIIYLVIQGILWLVSHINWECVWK